MKIFVKVRTRARHDRVTPPPLKLWSSGEKREEYYVVETKAEPIDGKANDAVILLLAEYFKVTRMSIKLLSGASSKIKSFKIG